MDTKFKKVKDILDKIYNEYEEVCQRKFELEEKMEQIEKIFSQGTIKETKQSQEIQLTPISDRLKGKTGKDAYDELVKSDFQDHPFKEPEIRKQATLQGLLVRGKSIKEVTSRSIIRDMKKDGILEVVGHGLYQYKKPE